MRVTKADIVEARDLLETLILKTLQDRLRANFIFSFDVKGSAKYNLVVTDNEEKFDIDYELRLSHNSKFDLHNATSIKNKFYENLRDLLSNPKGVENSKTAITFNLGLVDKDFGHVDVDIVITRKHNGGIEIIKRNADDNHQHKYTWNQWTPKYMNADEKVKELDPNAKNEFMNEVVRRKRKQKDKPSTPYKTGVEIFLEVLGEYSK